MKLAEHVVLGDHRGKLVAIEQEKNTPFVIKRVFYIYGTQPGVSRGQHAHHRTLQYLVAVNGSCKVTLDDGQHRKTFDLDAPSKGLFQDALVWGEMHDFSADCVLLVLANEHYEEADYIRDYADFRRLVNL